MKFTKKQRLIIYKKALQKITSGEASKCCYAISYSIKKYCCFYEIPELFPEFGLFVPDHNSVYVKWWENNDIKSRIIALEFCITMCKID